VSCRSGSRSGEQAIKSDLAALLLVLVEAVLLVVSALIAVPLWRSGWSRKWSYLFFLFWEIWLLFLLDRLYVLVAVPFAWQIGVEVVLFALMAATLILLYRHRRDTDPVDPDVP
jgi:hypothetical protein